MNIVIIGAGYAGVLTAKKLAKKFKKGTNVHITIIDKSPFHTMLTELHEVAAGRVEEESIRLSLKRIFAGRRVNVVQDTAESIDFEQQIVKGKSKDYSYDYLVIATGSKTAFYDVPGAKENAYTLWSYQDAVKLKERINQCFREAAVETDPKRKKELLSFCIVGAGFTGTELVAEMGEYFPILCEKYEINPMYVDLFIIDALSRVIPSLPEKLSAKIEKRLRKMNITLMLNQKVSAIGEDYIEIIQSDKKIRKTANTTVWVAGIEGSDLSATAADSLESFGRGRIQTDAYLRSVADEKVFVVGDNIGYIVPGESAPVPQMVENCEASAKTASNNIYTAITGKGKMKEYNPKFHGVMVSLGGRYGVARVGTPKFMVNLPSFFAMFCKHLINIVYFVQVLGWNKVFSYLKHEFFTIRNKRSFVGGHLSNRTPSFLLIPLRLWLGAVWLYEGIMKIVQGWFASPQLEGFFNGANAWFDSIINGGASSGATSGATAAAQSAATGVSEAAGTVLLNFNFLVIFRVMFVSGAELAKSKIDNFALKFDMPLMNWFINNVVTASEPMQMFMQGFIIIAEILIGLSMISGLLVTPSAAFSLVLQVMFLFTTGLYLSSFWMIFAAVALLFGGGQILGLDYYFIPALKKTWKKLPFVRRLYIYND
ncbi:MAG: NAD(P)/FAD-dependent oxidoreductase [Clostridiales bacterium]|nr:NAD(P)/FAD-dependent oxidoreductase [Clostridiales bacterium]